MDDQGGDDPAGRAPTVLVVDDEPDLCEIVRRMLEGRGYNVLTAGGVAAATALAAAHAMAIDLLITDLRMPDGDGVDLSRKLVAGNPGMALLYMSGLASDQPLDATMLAKPFTPTDLLNAVDTVSAARG